MQSQRVKAPEREGSRGTTLNLPHKNVWDSKAMEETLLDLQSEEGDVPKRGEQARPKCVEMDATKVAGSSGSKRMSTASLSMKPPKVSPGARDQKDSTKKDWLKIAKHSLQTAQKDAFLSLLVKVPQPSVKVFDSPPKSYGPLFEQSEIRRNAEVLRPVEISFDCDMLVPSSEPSLDLSETLSPRVAMLENAELEDDCEVLKLITQLAHQNLQAEKLILHEFCTFMDRPLGTALRFLAVRDSEVEFLCSQPLRISSEIHDRDAYLCLPKCEQIDLRSIWQLEPEIETLEEEEWLTFMEVPLRASRQLKVSVHLHDCVSSSSSWQS